MIQEADSFNDSASFKIPYGLPLNDSLHGFDKTKRNDEEFPTWIIGNRIPRRFGKEASKDDRTI